VSTPSPTWYDLLDVDPGASTDEIRAAWRSASAELDPGDRRFHTLSQAAGVLLDPDRRAEYDAGLAAAAGPAPAAAPAAAPVAAADVTSYDPVPRPTLRERLATLRPTRPTDPSDPSGAPATAGDGTTVAASGVPTWLLAGLLVLLLVAAGVTAWVWTQESAEAVEESTRTAQSAAEQAVVPILSYDHQTIEQDQQRAHGYLTEDYRSEYDKLIEVIAQNAPRTQTVVEAEVVSSGIVRSGEDRVQILVFVDRPTTNKLSREPVVYKDQVTLTMEKVGDDWLVDDMLTSPPQQ
jgi:Mce-associated membrane protein